MGFSFVGANGDGQNGTSVAPTYPSGVQAGDVVYLLWTYQTTATGVTNPSGYVQQVSSALATGAGTTRFLTRVCDGSETAGSPITCSASTNKMSAAYIIVRGVDTANVINGTVQVRVETVAGTSHASPSATPTVANCAAMVGVAERSSTGTSAYTAPSTYSKRAEGVTTAAGMTITAIGDDGLAAGRPSGTAVTPGSWSSSNSFSTANVQTFTWLIPPAASATVTGSATLAASGALTAPAVVRERAAATLSATGTAGASGGVRQRAAAAFAASGTLTATGRRTARGAAALTGSGTLTAAAVVRERAAAALAASGTLAAGGTVNTRGSAALSATSALTATSTGRVTGTAILTATGVLAASGAVRRTATAALSGTAILAASGRVRVLAAGALTAVGTLTASTAATPDRPGTLTPFDRFTSSTRGNARANGGITDRPRTTSTVTGGGR